MSTVCRSRSCRTLPVCDTMNIMKKAHLSKLAGRPLQDYLQENGYQLCPVAGSSTAPAAIRTHADLYFCSLGERLFCGDPARVGGVYPEDVCYNAACTGKYFIHNPKYTAPELQEAAHKAGLQCIAVEQGYAGCSTLVVDPNAIITADRGIAAAAEQHGLDVLLIRRGHILLPSYDYGFIGGAAGRLADRGGTSGTIVFNGNVAAHPDFRAMESFILHHDYSLKYFRSYPLTDIGGVIIESL